MKVVITINERLYFNFPKLKRVDKKCAKAVRKKFTHPNSKYHMLKRMRYSTKGQPEKFKSFVEDGNGKIKCFNRGCLASLRKILKEHGHSVRIIDKRLILPEVDFKSKIKLRKEQQEPVAIFLKKSQGIMRGPCSSGKTVMLLDSIARHKQPALIVVWDGNLQKQWLTEIRTHLGIREDQIGGCGGIFKKPKFGIINVCMQQSLKNKNIRALYLNKIGYIAGDEIQRFAATTFQEVLNEFPAKFRHGVTANERRKDGKHVLIRDTFGKILVDIPDTDIGSRRPSKIYMIPTEFVSDDYSSNNHWTTLISDMAYDKGRNKLIKKAVTRSLKKKKLCLILTERKSQALMLRFYFQQKGYETGLLLGNTTNKEILLSDWKKKWKTFMSKFDHHKEFERVKKLGLKRKIDIIIGTQKGDVGLSIKTIDHEFITTPTGTSLERFNQQKGRVERDHDKPLEKEFGIKETPCVYYFWDTKIDKLREAGNQIIKNYKSCDVLHLK